MNKLMLIFAFAGVMLVSCKKDGFSGNDTSIPAIPVTVSNVYGIFNGVPTVATSLAGGALNITLNIPTGSGRTIKEISRVALGTLPTNFKVVETNAGLYNPSPIAGSGTSVSFSTTLTEYSSKSGIAVTSAGTATSFLSRYFMFLVTLDNGQQLYPVGVRVYVTP